ncbi:MAG: MFS transporter [Acidocella sp.]|nr:MFS transporter [Acidocella sp.]
MLAPGKPETFFGEPRGLAFLAFTEAWERFSYYGMSALLVLYLTKQLLLPDHVAHVLGFTMFRAAIFSVFGRLTPLALASQIYGLYAGFVYFTPVFGGLLADRLTGRRVAVTIGAVLLSLGQVGMAFDASFLPALVLLVLGSGLLKGNISSQVGGLYAHDDAEGRTRGFAIFSIGINVGATTGPILCGLLAALYGWHAGFALSGGLMLCALATYLAGYRYLPEGGHRARQAHPPLRPGDRRVIGALLLVMALTLFQSIAYYQNTNIALLWIDQHVRLTFLGLTIPVAWFNSIDPLASIIFVPPLLTLWRRQRGMATEGSELRKITTGAYLAAAANLLLAVACLISNRTPAIIPLTYDVLLGIAFLYYWPTLLALVSRAAPAALKATLMGTVFLSLFVSNITIGWLGRFYQPLTPAGFWALNVGIAAIDGLLTQFLRRPLERVLEPRGPGLGPEA